MPDRTLTIGDFAFNSSAKFYRVLHGPFSEADLQAKFRAIRSESNSLPADIVFIDTKYQVIRNLQAIAEVSGIVFQRRRLPLFILDNEEFPETYYAYLFVIEYGGFVAIVEKQVSGFSAQFLSELSPIDYQTLSRSLLTANSVFREATLNNTIQSENVMQSKIIEAVDLDRVVDAYSNYSFSVSRFRISNEGQTFTVSLRGSGISEAQGRIPIGELARWVMIMVGEFGDLYNEPTFMDKTAHVMEFKDRPDDVVFDRFVFPSRYLEELLGDEGQLVKFDRNGNEEMAAWNDFDEVLDHQLRLRQDGRNVAIRHVRSVTGHPLDFDRHFRAEIQQRRVKLRSPELDWYSVRHPNQGAQKLLHILNQEQRFILQDSSGRYTYMDGRLHDVNHLLTFGKSMLQILRPYPELAACQSEFAVDPADPSAFAPDSQFRFVEDILGPELALDYLACDHRSTEWADFVGWTDDRVVFVHCKRKGVNDPESPGLQGALLSDVLGQVQRGVRAFRPRESELEERFDFWGGQIGDSQVDRFRIGDYQPEALEALRSALQHPNRRIEVHVVVNFISEGKVREQEALSLVPDRPRPNAFYAAFLWHIVQFLSILRNAGGVDFYLCVVP